MALSETVNNEILCTPILNFFFLKENDISNITPFYEVVFFCVAIMLQAEKTTLQMKAIHEYALGGTSVQSYLSVGNKKSVKRCVV